jgi:hypothetical protein
VTAIMVINAGSGYSSAPSVLIGPPPPSVSFTTYWSNDGTSVNGSEPAAAVGVPVSSGLFTVVLGDTTLPNMTSIDASLFGTQTNLGLRIWFNDGVHGSFALSPVQNLTPVPYAITAQNLSSVLENNTLIPGEYATIAGGSDNAATNDFATVGGGNANVANGSLSFVGGGANNLASGDGATVGGGSQNQSVGLASTVAGGSGNVSSNVFSTVGGGVENQAINYAATVGGGFFNTASGQGDTIAGGFDNGASGLYDAIGGGLGNSISGNYATVPGGYSNTVGGSFSLAAGYQAQANQFGSFVWNDESGGSFSSSTPNTFYARANGGFLLQSQAGITLAGDVAMVGGSTTYHHLQLSGGNSYGFLYGAYNRPTFGDGVHLGYNYYADDAGNDHVIASDGPTSRITAGYGEIVLAVGAVGKPPTTTMLHVTTSGVCVLGALGNCSDRNVKQDFEPVNGTDILDKVLQLPLSEWSYKFDAATRHIGPMAQDFYSAFNVGQDEKYITTVDEGGVALAAIQGLNQKLEQKDAEVQALKQRLEKLEQLLTQRHGGEN